VLAGDYTAGDYPATLEAAVRSGVAAARLAKARSMSSVPAPGAACPAKTAVCRMRGGARAMDAYSGSIETSVIGFANEQPNWPAHPAPARLRAAATLVLVHPGLGTVHRPAIRPPTPC
jgi:hypothetical protein